MIPIALLPEVPVVPSADFSHFKLTTDQEDGLWRIIGPTVRANLTRHGLDGMKQAFLACYWQGLENATSIITKGERA